MRSILLLAINTEVSKDIAKKSIIEADIAMFNLDHVIIHVLLHAMLDYRKLAWLQEVR